MNKVTLELTFEQVNVVLAGLAKLPLETSIDTFTTVRRQAESQVSPPQNPEHVVDNSVTE